MTAFTTISTAQTMNQKIQDAQILSQKGHYHQADQKLKEALKLIKTREQELSIYKLLYDNAHASEQQKLHLSLSNTLSERSILYKGNQFKNLKGLLAEQAYIFNTNYKGYTFNNSLYQGMYYALKEFNDPLTSTTSVYDSPGDIFVVNTTENDIFYTIHQNGSLLKWDSSNDRIQYKLFSKNWKMVTVKTVEVSHDKTSLFMAGTLNNKAFAEIFDMRDLSPKKSLTQLGSSIIDASYKSNEEIFLLDNYGKSISLFKNGVNEHVIEPSGKLRSIKVNVKGDLLFGAGSDGNLYTYEIDNNYRESIILSVDDGIESIAISDNDSILAVGDSKGLVYLKINNEWTIPPGHMASILEMTFSNDLNLFASASSDKAIRIYNLSDLSKDPLVLSDNVSRVTSIVFTTDNKRILAGTHNRTFKSWPINLQEMGGRICNYVSRNMTPEEWNQYIGPSIDYQMTCSNINTNEIPK